MLKTSRALPLSVAFLASAGALFAAVTARSADPDPTATGSASAPPAPTGEAPLSSASAEPLLFPVQGADIPESPTDLPRGQEWHSARKVRTARFDTLPCGVKVLRDWLRVECDTAGASLFAGDPTDVKIIAPKFPLFGVQGEDLAEKTTIFVRLRRGEAVMFHLHLHNFFGSGGGYGVAVLRNPSVFEGSPVLGNVPILSIAWREGRPDPIILVSKPGE